MAALGLQTLTKRREKCWVWTGSSCKLNAAHIYTGNLWQSQVTSAFQFLVFLHAFSSIRGALKDLPWTSMKALHVASPLGVEAMQVYRPVSPSWTGGEKNKYLKQSGTQWARETITALYISLWIWIKVLACKKLCSRNSFHWKLWFWWNKNGYLFLSSHKRIGNAAASNLMLTIL